MWVAEQANIKSRSVQPNQEEEGGTLSAYKSQVHHPGLMPNQAATALALHTLPLWEGTGADPRTHALVHSRVTKLL